MKRQNHHHASIQVGLFNTSFSARSPDCKAPPYNRDVGTGLSLRPYESTYPKPT
jgi:hypothetical protein